MRETTGGAFGSFFADCPCCGNKLNMELRIIKNLVKVEAKHWNVLPPLQTDDMTSQLPADPKQLLTEDEQERMNADLAEMARNRRMAENVPERVSPVPASPNPPDTQQSVHSPHSGQEPTQHDGEASV